MKQSKLMDLTTTRPERSTTPFTVMGCRQCLPLSVVQLKGKHCRKSHFRNGVVDTFGQGPEQSKVDLRTFLLLLNILG
jgi:hypothetical protein